MALYAIGDLHLSLSVNKPMDIFGDVWANHTEKILAGFSRVRSDDTVVLCGDTSWGISLEEALEDFRFIDRLPGQKLLLKGNHDYWWETAAKMHAFFEQHELHTLHLLHNPRVVPRRGNGRRRPQPEGAEPGGHAPGNVAAGGRGQAHPVLSPLSAAVQRLQLPGDPGGPAALSGQSLLLRPPAWPQSQAGHRGRAVRDRFLPGVCGLSGFPIEKNL